EFCLREKNKAAGKSPPLGVAPSGAAAYLQAGAPSAVAMLRAGDVAPTKISQLLAVLALVTVAVQPACVPVPVVMAPSVLPVVSQNAIEPAGAGLVQVLVVVYLIESAKYASSAVTRLRRSDLDRKSVV